MNDIADISDLKPENKSLGTSSAYELFFHNSDRLILTLQMKPEILLKAKA